MFVRKSTHDRELAIAHAISIRACEQRDHSNEIATANARSAEDWRKRALTAESELAKRKAHAIGNLRQFRRKKIDCFPQVI